MNNMKKIKPLKIKLKNINRLNFSLINICQLLIMRNYKSVIKIINKNALSPAITIQSNDVSIENVYFQNANASASSITLSSVTRCTIQNNFFTTGYGPAIVLQSNCTGNSITGNFIHGASAVYGIEVNASTGNALVNNNVEFGKNIFNFIFG